MLKILALAALLLSGPVAAETETELTCIDIEWHQVFRNDRYNQHMAILSDFTATSSEEDDFELSVRLTIFEYDVPNRLSYFFNDVLAPYKNNSGGEEVVDRIELTNENGNSIYNQYFGEIDSEGSGLPLRNLADVIKIDTMIKLVSNDVLTKMPEMLRTYTFSHDFGFIDGLAYNVEWELRAAELRNEARKKNMFYLYEEAIQNKKHLPIVSLKENEKAEIFVKHQARSKQDENHYISTVFVEDQFGRVVYLKELTRDDYDSVLEEFQYFAAFKDYDSLTPYEYCSLHGLFQGDTVLLPICTAKP